MSWSESNLMKVLTFSSRPQTACFHIVDGKRTAVVNRKLRKYADKSSCHAGHTMRFCRRLPSTVLLRMVPIIETQHSIYRNTTQFYQNTTRIRKHNTIFAKHNTKFSRLLMTGFVNIQSIKLSLHNRWHVMPLDHSPPFRYLPPVSSHVAICRENECIF